MTLSWLANADIKPGNALPFENIPVGTMIHNIELYPGKGGQLVRSAGVMAQLMAKENGYALVRLPSGEMRNVRLNCIATVGVVSNLDHENVNLGKAGRKRHMGVRPGSRGSVMNPATILTVVARAAHPSVIPARVLRGASPLWA